jgi:RNA polymerase subunit RPABC4/transcription elongation factor Spt4
MDQILQQVGTTISGFFGNQLIQIGFRATAVYVVVLWLAAAYWAFRDLQSRTDNPIVPYFASSLIILFTPVFFVLGIVVYRIVRPNERIGEVNERSLAEEALLNEVETVAHCAGCGRRVHEEWLICPTCRTRLQRVCPNCTRLVGLDWALCAWCGRDFERREPAPAPVAAMPSVVTPDPAPVIVTERIRKGGARSAGSRSAPDPLSER